HAPADDRDLAKWAGLPLRDARAALRDAAAPALRDEGLPPPRLLGAFDPVLLGWRSRAEIVGLHEPLIVAGGLFRPVALVEGRAAAVWRLRGGEVELEPFGRLSRPVAAALAADGDDVLRFLGLSRAPRARRP
ncbi:MAG TPA: crosslink repair DNA glycosylase YcaQ family protein, partial [Gaiellaceae bacterium]